MYRTPSQALVVVLFALAGCQREPSLSRSSPLDSLYQRSLSLVRAGDLEQARQQFQAGFDQSTLSTDRARFQAGLGICHQQGMRFRQALTSFRQALDEARQSNDPNVVTAILGNIAGVYARLGDVEHAVLATEEAIAAQPRAPTLNLLRLNRAIGLSQLGRQREADRAFAEVENAARGTELHARVLENLGYQHTLQGRLAEAEKVLEESLRERVQSKDPDLPDSYYVMARLRHLQGRHQDALDLLDRYLKAPGQHYWLGHVNHLRGQVEEAVGRAKRALASYREAITLVRASRRHVVPTERFQATAEARVSRIFDDFIRLAVRQSDPAAWKEAFAVAEESRAATWRAALFTPEEWSRRLPDSYWLGLARLQALEARGASLDDAGRREADRLRLQLIGDESRLAGGLTVPDPGHAPDPTTLVATDEAAFVYHVSKEYSVVWIVTRDGLQVRELPGEKELIAAVRSFREDLLGGTSAPPRNGGTPLTRILAGEFSGAQTTKYYWTIVPDGPLFELPFAALSGKDHMLIDRHALSLAATLTPSGVRGTLTPRMAAFGDPIYNGADSRLSGVRFAPASLQLNRLPGSGEEVARATGIWRGIGLPADAYLGSAATRDRLFAVMDQRPAVLHLATHVVPGDDSQAAPRLALSIDAREARPETVSARDLASRRAAPGVVIMSGCDSGAGPVLPAAGLMGLTRAWLLSGASAVVATLWPVPDDAGQFTEFMHRRLAAEKGESIANTEQQELRRVTARALRGAMLEARQSGAVPPVTWAAFFSMGRN